MLLYLKYFYTILVITARETQGSVASVPYLYTSDSCIEYWNHTVSKLLHPWKLGIQRNLLYQNELLTQVLGHTPLHLRVKNNKLYCVQHASPSSKLRLKKYRALHYINRVNRVLLHKNLSDNLEWWTHQSDWSKVVRNSQNMAQFPPIFAVAGGVDYLDIPGIPFMSFSDKAYIMEQKTLRSIKSSMSFENVWKLRKKSAFFRGSLSDCGTKVAYCSRAKIVLYAANSNDKFFSGVGTTTDLSKFSLRYPELFECLSCEHEKLASKKYIEKLFEYKYLLNFNGAGNWSRRLSTLFASGGAVFQVESSGYQFYELGLEPGVHYITFDLGDGNGVGNLRARLEWAVKNDEIMKEIASRSQSFELNCLQEGSIDYFVHRLLSSYEKLLQGNIKELPTVDLSSCIARNDLYQKQKSISRLCEGTLDKCWVN